jgi:hypothetical protein
MTRALQRPNLPLPGSSGTVVAYVAMRRLAGARAALDLLIFASLLLYVESGLRATPRRAYHRQLRMPPLDQAIAPGCAHEARQASAYDRDNLQSFGSRLFKLANASLSTSLPLQHIVLPLGMSFFTFQ